MLTLRCLTTLFNFTLTCLSCKPSISVLKEHVQWCSTCGRTYLFLSLLSSLGQLSSPRLLSKTEMYSKQTRLSELTWLTRLASMANTPAKHSRRLPNVGPCASITLYLVLGLKRSLLIYLLSHLFERVAVNELTGSGVTTTSSAAPPRHGKHIPMLELRYTRIMGTTERKSYERVGSV